jgi:flagellar hook-associated protein 1
MSSNLINIGLSGLNAAQWGLTTTSENISNSTTPGYDVESPVYSETSGQYSGSGYLPQGVSTTTIQRAYSQYLTTELNNAQSQSGSLSANYTMLAQLNNMVGSPTSGISSAITSYFTGLQNVANGASSLATRQTAISSAQTLASQLNAAGSQYDQLGQSINTQLTDTVSQINTYTAQIASLNQQINAASTQGQPPNQLLDQRDQAISSLSSLVGVQVVANSTGDSVFMPNGQALVVGTTSYNLGTAPSLSNPSENSITYLGAAGTTPTAATTTYLTDSKMQNAGGTLGGLIQFRTQSLDPAEAQLGAIATSFAAQVNSQNELGLDLNGNAGAALFSVAPPAVIASTNNTGTGALSVSFVNAAQPTTGNYTLSYDGNNYTLTDNATGSVVGTASNLSQPIDGLNINLTSGTINAGDSFNISPTSGALDSFALTTTSGSAIAAASPVLATASTSNSGNATISQGAVSSGYWMTSNATLTYGTVAGVTGLSGFPVGSAVSDGTTVTQITSLTQVVPYTAPGGATLTIINGTPPPTPSSTINGVSFTISGTPASGDTFTIAQNTGSQGDGRNATLMSNIVTAQALNGGTATLTTAYANYVNTIGNTTNEVNASNTTQTSLVTQVTSAQQSVSGVNMNEEAANLLQYQQLYQANSKVIQTADTLFQTILGIFQ